MTDGNVNEGTSVRTAEAKPGSGAASGSARQAATLLEIASKCHALAAELALGMELTKARYWQEKAEQAEALAAKITSEAPND